MAPMSYTFRSTDDPFLVRDKVAMASAHPVLAALPATPLLSAANPHAANEIALHQAKMKYAWDWFQFHADQRLKGFNYFVVVVGILIAAYGAAMKEGLTAASPGRSYDFFAGVVAVCGVVVSIAFLYIEVRNTELVECGRRWLDSLEQGLAMSIRQHDDARVCLPSARLTLSLRVPLPDRFIKHGFWIRVIYVMACVGFVFAFIYPVIWGFK
jgi:hypothetical protein